MAAKNSQNNTNKIGNSGAHAASVERPPVVVVMGHIDHGKSTLLDYIRNTKVVDREAGGITQHVSAYEAVYTPEDGSDAGKKRRVTFLDTPGHEAFHTLRTRGAKIADVAILVVSAEDGVKTQTVEALKQIREQKIPFVVAINKIDKPNTDINRTKVSLAENDIYVEGFGGDVSCVPISAKTGAGITELLDVVFLATDLQELRGNPSLPAKGIVIESKLDPRKGISATLIIKDGTLHTGDFVVAGGSMATVRGMDSDTGARLSEATFSTPVSITGWSEIVPAGVDFQTFSKKEDAIAQVQEFKSKEIRPSSMNASAFATGESSERPVFPIVIKADTLGSLEAIRYEIGKIKNDRIRPRIISEGVGAIGEGDVKTANGNIKAAVLGFNTKADSPAKILAERDNISIEIFSIIYKLTERVEELLKLHTPKMMVDEVTGSARIIRTFSRQRDKQIVGGKVDEGFLATNQIVTIIRREAEIGTGRIRGMQQAKKDANQVDAGNEFGAVVESKFEIAAGDTLRAFQTVEK